jgi:thioredoxin 2
MADPSTVVTCPNCATKNRVRPSASGVPSCSACHTPLPWIVDAAPDTFDQELKASVPVLVDFWAPWCGPCRAVSPLVEELGREHAGHLKVVKLNIDEAPQVSAAYDIRGIPLLLLVRDGAETARLVGAAPKAQLQAWLQPHLSPSPSAASS